MVEKTQLTYLIHLDRFPNFNFRGKFPGDTFPLLHQNELLIAIKELSCEPGECWLLMSPKKDQHKKTRRQFLEDFPKISVKIYDKLVDQNKLKLD